jgi:hypothetical protein
VTNLRFLFLLGSTLCIVPQLFFAETIDKTEKKKEKDFDLTATFDHIHASKFSSPHVRRHDSLSFTDSNVLANYKQELSEKNGLEYGIGYNNVHFGWDKHPKLEEKNIHNLLLSFGGYTKERENWRWNGKVYLQMNTEHLSLSRYTLFRGFLHGVYDWKKDIRLHTGLEGVTGMRYTRIWPVIGFDWKYSPKIHFNVILPSNISAIYSFTDRFSAVAAVRFFLSRQRLGNHEHHHLKRALIAYRNTGLELGLNYQIAEKLLANVHVGEAFGGRLRVSRRNDSHRHHYKLNAAPYLGAALQVSF